MTRPRARSHPPPPPKQAVLVAELRARVGALPSPDDARNASAANAWWREIERALRSMILDPADDPRLFRSERWRLAATHPFENPADPFGWTLLLA